MKYLKYPLPFAGGNATLWQPEEITAPLPTIYLQDGSFFESFLPGALAPLPPLLLVQVQPKNRSAAYTPWPAPPVFKGEAPFEGGMPAFLHALEGLKTYIDSKYPTMPAAQSTGLIGVSLSGLLPFFALAQSGSFGVCCGISASLWYPGFVEYVMAHKVVPQTANAMFLLGDTEGKTKNPTLQKVNACHEALFEYYKTALGEENAAFTLTPGGHAADSAGRLNMALTWAAQKLTGSGC